MKKVAVIGHFGFGTESLDGQTVKTKILTGALCDHFGEQEVLRINTHNWKKHPADFAWKVTSAVWKAENVLILPAHNGLRVLVPLLYAARMLRPGCKLHYSVIGGWLPILLQEKKLLRKQLKAFHGIYVETQTMKNALEAQGFTNIRVMPNCKNLEVLSPEKLVYADQQPYKLCTFSRVMQEKGIGDAVEAVMAVNSRLGRTAFTLDIYGQIDPKQKTWFEDLQRSFSADIRYRGTVPFEKSVETLKYYFALLFPTRFYTEGIPGTIIDAYAAGIPVICSRWESCADVVDDGVTGITYPFEDMQMLQDILIKAAYCPEWIQNKKENCLLKTKQYVPEEVIPILAERMK